MRDRQLIHGQDADAIVSTSGERVSLALIHDQRLEAIGSFSGEEAMELAFALLRLAEFISPGTAAEKISEDSRRR